MRSRWVPFSQSRPRRGLPVRRWAAQLAAILLVVTTLSGAADAAARPGWAGAPRSSGAPAGGVVLYRAPVSPLNVLRAFAPPATRYGAGHLGVDLAVGTGEAVRTAGTGTVTFAGSVAGRGVVVVTHPDGIRTEYEPLAPSVRAGAEVTIGSVLGIVHGPRHRGCPRDCLHWGARRGDTYLDPLSLLRPLGPVRLLPWSRSG